MGDFLLGPATPVPLRARRLHWLLPRWGGGMLRVAGDTRTVATLPSAGASDRSSRRHVVRKTSIQCFPHLFFGGRCAPTQRWMDSLPPPRHAGDGSSVCGAPGSPNRVAAWHARFLASAWKGEERREGRILLRHGKGKRRRMEFLRITGLHVEAEPSEVVTTQLKQRLTAVIIALSSAQVWSVWGRMSGSNSGLRQHSLPQGPSQLKPPAYLDQHTHRGRSGSIRRVHAGREWVWTDYLRWDRPCVPRIADTRLRAVASAFSVGSPRWDPRS